MKYSFLVNLLYNKIIDWKVSAGKKDITQWCTFHIHISDNRQKFEQLHLSLPKWNFINRIVFNYIAPLYFKKWEIHHDWIKKMFHPYKVKK